MKVKTLYKSGALGLGASLWVLPELINCRWAQRIDWYLNLQLSKAKLHTPKALPVEILDILEENEWSAPENENQQNAPLLVASLNQLPNDQVVRAPLKETIDEWVHSIFNLWVNLEKPTLRVFLADSYKIEEFIHCWDKYYKGPLEITIVPALENSEA